MAFGKYTNVAKPKKTPGRPGGTTVGQPQQGGAFQRTSQKKYGSAWPQGNATQAPNQGGISTQYSAPQTYGPGTGGFGGATPAPGWQGTGHNLPGIDPYSGNNWGNGQVGINEWGMSYNIPGSGGAGDGDGDGDGDGSGNTMDIGLNSATPRQLYPDDMAVSRSNQAFADEGMTMREAMEPFRNPGVSAGAGTQGAAMPSFLQAGVNQTAGQQNRIFQDYQANLGNIMGGQQNRWDEFANRTSEDLVSQGQDLGLWMQKIGSANRLFGGLMGGNQMPQGLFG